LTGCPAVALKEYRSASAAEAFSISRLTSSTATWKKLLFCSWKRRRSDCPARAWSREVMSNDRALGPSWTAGSPGLVEKTVCRTVPAASMIWTRYSSCGSENPGGDGTQMRSDHFRVALPMPVGTANACVRS
jgi:hypothetical protein